MGLRKKTFLYSIVLAERFEPDEFMLMSDGRDEIGALGRNLHELYGRLRENYGELESKNRLLEEENERQEVFLRASSHQLKTPIAAALLLVEGMINEVGKYMDTKTYLPEVKKQLLSMRKIVEDILYLNCRAENLQQEEVAVETLVRELTEIYAVQAEDKGLRVRVVGDGALYSQEVEHEVPLRMRLFGFRKRSLLAAKIIAHMIQMTAAFVIFAVFQMLTMDIPKPAASSLICLLVSLYLIGVILLVIAHSLADIFRKFGITFGITMSVYFLLMVLTGMMGISTEQLPKALQKVAATLPMTYASNYFADFWTGGSYNFMPFIQSLLFFGAIAGILLMYAQYRNGRT